MIEKIEEALESLKGMADQLTKGSGMDPTYDYEHALGMLNAVKYIEGTIAGAREMERGK